MNATAVTVQWTKPDTANGIITRYIIRYNTSMFNVSDNTTSVTVGDLLPFTFYEFEVSAFTIEEGPNVSVTVRTNEAGKI